MSSADNNVGSSAEAYLQTYIDDPVEAKSRALEGIPLLIKLLSHDSVSVHKDACGALQDLSSGPNNDDNKRAIKNEKGIPELIQLLGKTVQEDVLESVTSILWNLSSCKDLKLAIIEDGLSVLVDVTLAKYADYPHWGDTAVFSSSCQNTMGIIRNVSSAGFEARKQLRECKGLVNTLINILKSATRDDKFGMETKPIENTVCILRNLSYHIQEVVEPDFYKRNPSEENEDEVGCFGKKKSSTKGTDVARPVVLPPPSMECEGLWGWEIHNFYSVLISECTNPITLEAAAGAIQNLTACDWQPAVDSRTMLRQEKFLPKLVDLLELLDSDRVLCATTTALRNLAIDDRNKELIGKYSVRNLAARLPKDNGNKMPDDTICAIVATLYEVVQDNENFAMSLIKDGLPSLMHINRSDGCYLACTLKFTITLLKTMWSFKSLRSEYAACKYYKTDFTKSKATPRQEGCPPQDMTMPPSCYTLNRPISSQGISCQGWDDNTLPSQTMQAMQLQ